MIKLSPAALRRFMNLWPPFFASGIRVVALGDDWRHATVRLRAHRWNLGFVGTHFGGNLFAMTDPFWMIMVMHSLGEDYIVWDKAATIDFVAPGRGEVFARFDLDPVRLGEIRAATADGAKYLPWFETEVRDPSGTLIACIRKQLYIRRKRRD